MTQQEIIRMARKAGFVIWSDTSRKGMVDWACEYDTELKRFAALVAAHEREACAVAAEQVVPRHTECGNKIAATIRARGDK